MILFVKLKLSNKRIKTLDIQTIRNTFVLFTSQTHTHTHTRYKFNRGTWFLIYVELTNGF